MTLTLTPIPNIPLIQPGDNLADIVLDALSDAKITLQNNDILVFAQKVVSKAENRLVYLQNVSPSSQAIDLANSSGKDPRFVQLILQESNEVLRVRPGLIIVEHKKGFICANAGIDHSNVQGPWGNPDDWVLLLPEDPDLSARNIRQSIQSATGISLGILVIDSHGRAWRNGTVGITIGVSNVPAIVDKRGDSDLFGYRLRVTLIAAADELAAAASLVMGQADEKLPIIHVRGFPYPLRESVLGELIRTKEQDLFR